MKATLNSIEYGSYETSTGKSITGYMLSCTLDNNDIRVIKIPDFQLKKSDYSNLKEAIQLLEKTKLPSTIEVGTKKDKGFSVISSIEIVKNEPNKYVPKGDDRQISIERQNALTNATNLVTALIHAKALDNMELEQILEIVSKTQAEMLNMNRG